ncbi:hypothetical protein RSAG8_06236, partial [Rhizoctonia solani AG-8 WAC10335]
MVFQLALHSDSGEGLAFILIVLPRIQPQSGNLLPITGTDDSLQNDIFSGSGGRPLVRSVNQRYELIYHESLR